MDIQATTHRIAGLAFKKVTGQLSPAEAFELNQFIEQSEENRLLIEQLMNAEMTAENTRYMSDFDLKAGWQHVQKELGFKKRVIHFPFQLIAAAAIVVVIGVVTFFMLRDKPGPLSALPAKKAAFTGDTIAVISNQNDSAIVMRENKTGAMAIYDGRFFKEIKDTLFFSGKDSPAGRVIRTRPGMNLHIQLDDGSHVWIDGSSQFLITPGFSPTQRRVAMHGRAYFEVAKNTSSPFSVTTDKVEVKVLGTKFIIDDYRVSEGVTTGLIEGSVQLTSQDSSVILHPGQEAVVRNGSFKKRLLSPQRANNVQGLKQGLFIFDRDDIHTILAEIARSYEYTVEYDSPAPNTTFTGSFSRATPLPEILKHLGNDMKINITLLDRCIIVSGKAK